MHQLSNLVPIVGGTGAEEDAATTPLWGHCSSRNRYNQKLIASKWPFPLRYEITSKSKLMKSKLAGNESTNSNFV
jgi:hypothetical protein